MSYILDALQRADAERARGGVPTLHARPLAGPPLAKRFGKQQRLGLTIAVVGLVLLGMATVGWWMWRPAPTPAVVTVAPAPVQAVVPPPSVVPAPAVPVAAQATPVAVPAPPPKTRVKASATTKAEPPAPASTPASAPTPTLAPLLSELPEATRSQIPALSISGAVYSDNPAQRLLIVNGQVLNQGSHVTPDLTLVEIHANVSEFNFKGTRFRVAH